MSGLILRNAIQSIKRITERQVCEDSLIDFCQYVWPVVEPAIPFIRGWAIEAIATHLQAVTEGHIKRLLINVPPGFTKSLLTDVMWPAWEWGPRNMPWLRYVCASYSNHLTERDNMRCRNIVISDLYKKMWGNRFKISNEQFTKIKFANDQTGWKLATSVGGIGVGERGDRFICFPADELVNTRSGLRSIGQIVDNKEQIDVLSFDTKTNKTVYKPIVGWHKNPSSQLLRLVLSDGNSIRCTPDHRFWSSGKWIIAKELIGKFLSVAGSPDSYSSVSPYSASANAIDSSRTNAVSHSKSLSSIGGVFGYFYGLFSGENGHGPLFIKRESSMPLSVSYILRSGSIFKVIKSIIQGFSVLVTSIMSFRTLAYECAGDNNMNIEMKGFSISSKIKTLINRTIFPLFIPNSGSENFVFFSKETESIPHISSKTFDSSISGRFIVRKAWNLSPNLKVVAIEDGGHADATYCLTVKDTHTLCIGGMQVIASNCDDPNNTMDMESQVIRDTVNMWFTEVVPTRLNNPKESAIVIIQQRLHEDDVSGTALSREMGYTHLMIPMEYDKGRHCVTVCGMDEIGNEIKWEDPREEDYQLAWTERFPQDVCDAYKRDQGPYVWSGQFQQTPEPRGGSIIKRDYWQLWDKDSYPPFEFILASLDTAFTSKEENDPSALTIWGVFREASDINELEAINTGALWMPRNGQTIIPVEGNPKIMLIYAWEGRLEFSLLFQKVIDICTMSIIPKETPSFPVDRLLIEAKANGMSVGHELIRLFRGTGKLGIELINPKIYGDKVARVQSIQHLFSGGMIYAPDKSWSDMMINQAAIFPKGSHDDLVDSMSQALRYLRDQGFALNRKEYQSDVEDSLEYKSPSANLPLYQV